MFQTVLLSIIRSLFTVHSVMVYVIQVCGQLSRRAWPCSKAVCKPVWHIPLLSVQWINSWWWTEELSETCRITCQNKFVKLVHLVAFIIKKFVTMHGHLNVKLKSCSSWPLCGWPLYSLSQSHVDSVPLLLEFLDIEMPYFTATCLP